MEFGVGVGLGMPEFAVQLFLENSPLTTVVGVV